MASSPPPAAAFSRRALRSATRPSMCSRFPRNSADAVSTWLSMTGIGASMPREVRARACSTDGARDHHRDAAGNGNGGPGEVGPAVPGDRAADDEAEGSPEDHVAQVVPVLVQARDG